MSCSGTEEKQRVGALPFGRLVTEAVRGVCAQLLVPGQNPLVRGDGVKYAVNANQRQRIADTFSFQLGRLADALLNLSVQKKDAITEERLESVDQAFAGFIALVLPSAHAESDSEHVSRKSGLRVVEHFFKTLLSLSVTLGVKFARLDV